MALASLATNEIEMLWNSADEVKQEGVMCVYIDHQPLNAYNHMQDIFWQGFN
jgi:ABC-type sugar transport system ATPase subunit